MDNLNPSDYTWTEIQDASSVSTTHRHNDDLVYVFPLPGYIAEDANATYHPNYALLEVVAQKMRPNSAHESVTLTIVIPERLLSRTSLMMKHGELHVHIKDYFIMPEGPSITLPVEG